MIEIQGIDKFKEYFEDFSEDYVVIGGLATALLMDDYGFLARATKDIDLVVISGENEEFLKRLLSFIELAGYQTKQRTDNENKHNLFRFCDSENKEYPHQVELFAIHQEDSSLITDSHIIPIETPEFYAYLSAILLDKDYYKLLIEHTTKLDGLHIATPEVLIPLKIHAHLNLMDGDENYDNKHLKDVIKLTSLLDGEEQIILNRKPKEDFESFIPIVEGMEKGRIKNILKSMQATGVTKEDILELLKITYVME